MKFNCQNCEKEGKCRPSRPRTYCSTKCQMQFEYRTGKRNGKIITEKAHQTLREKGHYKRDNSYLSQHHIGDEARKRMSEQRKGMGNPMFGKPSRHRNADPHLKSRYIKQAEWIRTKKLVLIRDNFTCQSCGITKERALQEQNAHLQVHDLS